MTADEKLDKVLETTADTRLAVATLHGEVREVSNQIARHDTVNADVEHRLRALERRIYSLPTLATIVGLASLAVAVWAAWHN